MNVYYVPSPFQVEVVDGFLDFAVNVCYYREDVPGGYDVAFNAFFPTGVCGVVLMTALQFQALLFQGRQRWIQVLAGDYGSLKCGYSLYEGAFLRPGWDDGSSSMFDWAQPCLDSQLLVALSSALLKGAKVRNWFGGRRSVPMSLALRVERHNRGLP